MTTISKQSLNNKAFENPGSGMDFLGLAKEPRLINQLQANEKILYSCWIEKFNETNKCQARIFLLTDQAIYNLIKSENFIKSIFSKIVQFQNKFIIRRKIVFQTIDAITLSNLQGNNEFVLHVTDDYDYRFQIPDIKMKANLLKSVCLQYEKMMKKKMAFYFMNDLSLKKYCTFKSDIKNKKDKKPLTNPVYLNVEDLIDYELPGVKFDLVYSKSKDEIEIGRFKSSSLEMMKQNRKYFSLQNLQIRYEEIEQKLNNKSPFILLPSYCFETQSHTYLLRQLMTGGILEKVIVQNGTFNKKLTTFYIGQIILALQKLHSNQWIYRNLSLNKIYIKNNGYIALEGLNKFMKKKKKSGKCFDLGGIQKNLSPQMILCEGYDQSIDIWGLGILTYELIFGHHPFAVQNKKQTLSNILKLEIEKSPNLPKFVYEALAKNASKRITLSQIKKDEWFVGQDWKLLERQEISAPYVVDFQKIKEWQGNLPSIVYLEQQS